MTQNHKQVFGKVSLGLLVIVLIGFSFMTTSCQCVDSATGATCTPKPNITVTIPGALALVGQVTPTTARATLLQLGGCG